MGLGGVTVPVTVAWLLPHCGLYHALTVARLNMSNLTLLSKVCCVYGKIENCSKRRVSYRLFLDLIDVYSRTSPVHIARNICNFMCCACLFFIVVEVRKEKIFWRKKKNFTKTVE